MIYKIIKKFNLFTAIVIFSVISVVISFLIVYFTHKILNLPQPVITYVLSVTVPAIISPLASYFFLSLIIKINKSEEKLKIINSELEEALKDVKELSGILPICASCKKIRDDDGYWNQVEEYLSKKTNVSFSHALCPVCYEAESKKIDRILEERESRETK